MDSNIKISVIIPVFNAENYIENALLSIINQTQPVYEIIIVDDGSTDSTFAKVNNFIVKHSMKNIKVITQDNAGPSSARNKGINLSNGNWIAFLDSDDQWNPDKIEEQTKCLLENPDVAIISSKMNQDNMNESKLTTRPTFFKSLWKNPFFTSSVMIKRDVFKSNLFDERQKYSEDYKLYLDILKYYPAIIINKKLVHYNSDKNVRKSSLSSKLWEMEKGELKNFKYLYKKKYINIFTYSSISLFSLLKFMKRVIASNI